MVHQGDSGGNMARPNNPLGHFKQSFQTPANIGALRPNSYAGHGWSQGLPQQQQQAPRDSTVWDQPLPPPPPPQHDAHVLQRLMVAMAPNGSSAVPPIETNSYGATSWARPMVLPPSGLPRSCAPPVQQPGGVGQTSWAPPAQRPGMPAASPASGSAQARPRVGVAPGNKTFEEFLLEAGVLDQWTVDRIFLEDVVEKLLVDGPVELGPAELDSLLVGPGTGVLAPGPGSSTCGPSRHQVGLSMVPAQEAVGAGAGARAVGGCGRDHAAAAAEARERRSRRMAKRKEAAARPRPKKLADARGRKMDQQRSDSPRS